MDYVECFLPWHKDINAGPNARRFIREQSEHPKTTHIDTVDSKSSSSKLKRQSVFSGSSGASSSKVIVLDEPGTGSTQTTFSAKFAKKHLKQGDLNNYLGCIPLFGECSNSSQIEAKSYCLYVIHKGVRKALSHAAILENYEAGYEGQLLFREGVASKLQKTHPAAVADVPQVIKVQLNDHNINDAERAILDTYRYDEEKSLYKKLDESPYYSIMHDGISKFANEFNGVFLRGLDADHSPINVPFCLSRMKGGVTGVDTANEILSNLAQTSGETSTAYTEMMKCFELENVENPHYISPTPPNYFKIGSLAAKDDDLKLIKIKVSEKFPVGNIGDGVAVNVKAARVLRDIYGFMSPDFRCSAHSASGTVKRLTTSKTMNVPEVTVVYECLRTVIKHFEQSIKNKETLDQAMEILDMTPLHLLSWCQTRMAHFLKSCAVFDDMLAAIYDTMYTRGIRIDERDLLFTCINVYIIKVMADLQPKFYAGFLRKADVSDLLVSEVFNMSESFAKSMENFTTPSADAFFVSLEFDGNGNLNGSTLVSGNPHTMMLNHPHKPSRGVSEEQRLEKVKYDLENVKDAITKNIIENVRDQCTEETYYYCWSGLDLSLKLSIEQRKERLSDIVTLFCTTKVHTVQKYTNAKEEATVNDIWEGYKVELEYPAKINASEQEFYDEFSNAMKTVNGLYISEINQSRMQKREPKQLKVWQAFLSAHYLEFPAFGQLIQILLATAGNTSPLERGYTYLEMIASKRRNKISPEHLETLFLLTALKIPIKGAGEYRKEVARCNKKTKK